MRLPLLLLLPSLAACGARWEPIESAANPSAPPDVYVTDPTLGSTWSAGVDMPVRAVIADDVDDAESLVVEIRSDLEGVVATPVLRPDGALDADIALTTPGVHVLTIAAVDTDGNEGTDTVTVRVVEGSFPSQPVVTVAPSAPVAGDTLDATLLEPSVDPEGDPLTYIWSWTVDGVDAGVVTPTVDGARVADGETWAVTVYATDGTSVSPTATRAVSIGAPVDVGVVEVLPGAPVTGETLTCAHAPLVTDDGSPLPVSYAWTIDGLGAGERTVTLPGDRVVRGDQIACTLLVEDGSGRAYDAAPVQVGNALPVASAPTITPADADAASLLTCRIGAATDPEGDPVTTALRWLVDGVDVGTGATLGGVFSRGDAVACEITPSDPYGAGPTVASAATVIGNAPPGAPAVAITPDLVVTGSVATCGVTGAAVDPDGDSVTYTFGWEVDGVARAETGAAFSASGLSDGAEVTCVATPTDGTESGAPGTATVTLGVPSSGDFGTAEAWITITGSSTSAAFGKAVDTLADLDGDSLPELLVSAPRGNGSTKGAVYLFTSTTLGLGTALTDADADAWWVGHAADDNLGGGRGVVGIGDHDGDGVGDLAVAAPINDDAGSAAGAVYLLYGGEAWTAGGDIQNDSDARMRGATGDWLGVRMAGGDLDGDGLDDLAVTAPYNDLRASKAGVAAVYYGDAGRLSGTLALSDADALVTGALLNTELGWSLDISEDADGDGYGELLVGVFYDDTNATDAGAAAAISGDALGGQETFLDAAWLVVYGLGSGARMGYDVGGVGDVDGDGLADLAFGAYFADDVDIGADAGETRLFYGVSGLTATVDADAADASFFGATAGEQFGSTLTSAGDWDGDGLADMLFGAPRSGVTGAEAGYARLYLGREASGWSAAGASPSVGFTGGAAGDWLSDELAGGLDVNADGYSDIALGAQAADVGASGGGAVYVFIGP